MLNYQHACCKNSIGTQDVKLFCCSAPARLTGPSPGRIVRTLALGGTRAAVARTRRWEHRVAFLISGAVLAIALAGEPSGSPFRVRWLVELGVEAPPAASAALEAAERPLVAAVPGGVYVFTVEPSGALRKTHHLVADPAAPYGVAVTERGAAVANLDGTVSLWASVPGSALSLRWQRELGERVSSLQWDGGDLVLAATWRNRLLALAAADGHTLWGADIGGRAEAPPLLDGDAVFVATKTKALFRLDRATGAVRWKISLPGVVLHPPVAAGDRPRVLVCGTWDGQLVAHDPLTGRVRWTVTLPTKLAGPPLGGAGHVGAVTADGGVHLYDPSGQVRWSQPGSAEGAATLLPITPAGRPPSLLVASRTLVSLDLENGTRLADYPAGAAEELKRRFADAMLEGEKTFTEGEKRALIERQAFDIQAPLFGPARTFGPYLVFGTEEGWSHVFASATLRPVARYHGGVSCTSLAVLARATMGATAGPDLFALDAGSGRVQWKRGAGADVTQLVGEGTIAMVAGGRLHALDPKDGVPRWTLRGPYRAVAPSWPAAATGAAATTTSAAPWLVADDQGGLRVVSAEGRVVGEPLPVSGEIVSLTPMSDGSWVAATRDVLLGITWLEPTLARTWDKAISEHVRDVWASPGRTIVRTEAGALIGLDESHQEAWRVRLGADDRVSVVPRAGSVLVSGPTELKVYDAGTGSPRATRKVTSAPLACDVSGASVLWLDRGGRAHRADLTEGGLEETSDLGLPLSAAVPASEGFLVITAAGEVGFVEPASTGPARASNRRGEGQ
jgi:outer membrane protein assembly factor BamB